jgi:hypothetical protein
MTTTLTPIESLLLEAQKQLPNITKDSIESLLSEMKIEASDALSKPGKLNAFISRLQQRQPGAIAIQESGIVSSSTKSKAPAPIAKSIEQTPTLSVAVPEVSPVDDADRDWSAFNIREIGTLSKTELEAFKAWRKEEAERQALINEILGDEAAIVAAEEKALENKLTIAETTRRVLKARAQVEVLDQGGTELDELVAELGKKTGLDQIERDRRAFTELSELGESTPTEGELLLLQGKVVNRDRMNRAVQLQNSTAQEVKAIAPTAEAAVQTIDV